MNEFDVLKAVISDIKKSDMKPYKIKGSLLFSVYSNKFKCVYQIKASSKNTIHFEIYKDEELLCKGYVNKHETPDSAFCTNALYFNKFKTSVSSLDTIVKAVKYFIIKLEEMLLKGDENENKKNQ